MPEYVFKGDPNEDSGVLDPNDPGQDPVSPGESGAPEGFRIFHCGCNP